MVEPDASVLADADHRRRIAAFVVLGAAVGAWYAVSLHVAWIGLWPSVVVISAGVLPATLGLAYVALPLWSRRWMFPAAVAIGLVAFATWHYDWKLASNFAKLVAFAFVGWAFLQIFEELAWVVLVAVIIPIADAISVFAPHGPTHEITAHHVAVYNDVAVAFLAPGRHAIQLGPPDILFYALFLAAARRWSLRPGWTWLATTAMYAIMTPIAIGADVDGLPALPFLSVGFLAANGDLLWRRLRRPAR